MRQRRKRQHGNKQSDRQSQRYYHSRIARRTSFQPHAESLAYCGKTAASDKRGQQHEQSKQLPDHAERSLSKRRNKTADCDIGQTHAHMAQHEAQLRYGKKHNIPQPFRRRSLSAGSVRLL